MIHVESPIHEAELKPPLYKLTALDINLKHNNKPDSLDLGIVKLVLNGVTQDLAAKNEIKTHVILGQNPYHQDHHQEVYLGHYLWF